MPPLELPGPLVDAILEGRCVAFVGAGFSATVIPAWTDLLENLASHPRLGQDARGKLSELIASGEQMSFEAAAQLLVQQLGTDGFSAALAKLLAAPECNDEQRRRIDHLLGIPFRGILTTNFDGLLEGSLPGRDSYRGLLRPMGSGWYQDRYWHGEGPPVVKLHGCVCKDPSSIVLTRRDYRERLYMGSAYATFLRTVFATNTLLFLGCSFSDPYLNELRSEVLAMLEQRASDEPWAYALAADKPVAQVEFLRSHEGVEVLSYAHDDPPNHGAFDDFLARLYRCTNPQYHLGRLLSGQRLLWLDPNPNSTEDGIELLRHSARLAAGGFHLTEVTDVTGAMAELGGKSPGPPYGLVISHWGQGGGDESNAERLLGEMRRHNVHVPVIVFASGSHADENKQRALRAGAMAYCYHWSSLFRRIGDAFDHGLHAG
ncbi:MAG: SIR2 family protein [Deltaproteobacteria bacterium]|nr:SIR2 family protein [Deltaproteobacteria bacterium]